MRKQTVSVVSAALLFVALASAAFAADSDSKVSREREMLRRAQEALRQSQSDNNDLARAKQDAEQKLKAASQEVEAARNSSKAGQASLRTQLQTSAAAQAELTRKLEDANRQVAALTTQNRDTLGQLASRESELKRIQQDLEKSKAAGTSCEAKNLQLFEYSQELLQRYQKKGVWASLSQKDPVLGLKAVSMENVVQEYREKLNSQKIEAPQAVRPTGGSDKASTPAH
jgi:DNA repair exonuclease SbcCD ATPase subunit